MKEEFSTLFHGAPLRPAGFWKSAAGGWESDGAQAGLRFFRDTFRDRILFGAEVDGAPRELDPAPGFGTFFEGLWRADVIELFLFSKEGLPYFEFNVSPSGAWWSMKFRDFRVRSESYPELGLVEPFSERVPGGWRAALRISLNSFITALPDWPDCRTNLCAVSGEKYISLAEARIATPDFHFFPDA